MNNIIANNIKNGGINIFEQWKNIHIRLAEIKNANLREKKGLISSLEEQYNSIVSNAIRVENGSYEFNLSNLVKIVKYLNASNVFFNNRVTPEMMDEILLLVYLYEWLCLGKEKDQNILGTKDDVISKFRSLTYKTNSEYQMIFNGLSLDDENDYKTFTSRIRNATFRAYNFLLNIITLDNEYMEKIKFEEYQRVDPNDETYFIKLWKDTFSIEDERVTFSYSAINSDDVFIFINVETKTEQVAFVKFRMFETFSSRSGTIVSSGISKEILRIEFLNSKYENIGSCILSNALKLANRVIKYIYLPELRFRNEQLEIERQKEAENNAVVKFVKK